MAETLYASMTGGKKPFNYLRLWKILTLVSTLVALTIAAVFIWYVLSHKARNESNEQHAGTNIQNVPRNESNEQHAGTNIQNVPPCPQLPTLFPLPKPTPKRITEVFKRLESALSDLVDKSSSLPAISMNVFYQDEILWSGHVGSKVYQHPETKPNDSTVYRIGSVTKIFAVLLLYKLYEEGKIASIDDPLSKYAPDFAIKNPFTNENITLREIASQMSGLPREAPCLFTCNTTSDEQLALLKNRTLILPPWVEPSYSNLGYGLLGRLLTENLLNQTFESWTHENILKPLGMVNTGFQITDKVQKNMAFPYLPKGKRMKFMNIGWMAPAGQMYSTIEDLAKLGIMFAQPEKQNIFKPATLREMMTPKDITPDGVTVWGSPFEMVFKEHVLIRTKGGNIDTYDAKFIVVPELALGANILTSTTYYLQPDASKGTTLLYSLLIPRLNETLFELQRDSHFPVEPKPFEGSFQVTQTNPIFGTIITYNVTISNYQNILRFQIPIQPSTTIEIRYIGEELVFLARMRTPGMSCFMERIGTLADLYYDPLGKDKLSHGFYIPQWEVVAKRVKATGDSVTGKKEENMNEFMFNLFKSPI